MPSVIDAAGKMIVVNMSSWENIYCNPEKYGLKEIAEIEGQNASWSFDTIVLWEDEKGHLYVAHDSGCSCPSPFEDFTSIDDLVQIHSVEEVQRFIQENSEHAHRSPERIFNMYDIVRDKFEKGI